MRGRAPIHFRGSDARLIELKAAGPRVAGRARSPQIAGQMVAVHSRSQPRLGGGQDFPNQGGPQGRIGMARFARPGTDETRQAVGGSGQHRHAGSQSGFLTGLRGNRSHLLPRSNNPGSMEAGISARPTAAVQSLFSWS